MYYKESELAEHKSTIRFVKGQIIPEPSGQNSRIEINTESLNLGLRRDEIQLSLQLKKSGTKNQIDGIFK